MKKLAIFTFIAALTVILSACARDLDKGKAPTGTDPTDTAETSSIPEMLDSSKQELLQEDSESSQGEEVQLPPLD
ncbi:MAG: hypothetical protein RRY40_06440, partial [Oscillospiraceae bacterium]